MYTLSQWWLWSRQALLRWTQWLFLFQDHHRKWYQFQEEAWKGMKKARPCIEHTNTIDRISCHYCKCGVVCLHTCVKSPSWQKKEMSLMKLHINHMNGASNEMNRHLSSPLIHSPSMYLSLRWTTRLISSDHLNLICLSFDLSPWSLPVVALETKVPLILILLNLYSIPDWTADADAGPLITIFTAFFFFLVPVPRTLSPPVFYQMTAGPCWWTTPAANGQLWPKLKRRGGARRRRACMSKPFSHYVTISLKNSANENEKKKKN